MRDTRNTEQLETLALLMKKVPKALRDCVTNKIGGMMDGVALAAAIEALKVVA